MVTRVPRPGPDPDPEPAEFLGAELLDDRAQAVVSAVAAGLAEPELAERQGKIVGDDEQVLELDVLAGQHAAHGGAEIIHVRQRLDEGQVEAVVAAHHDVRLVALAPTPRPAGTLGQPVQHEPATLARPAYRGPGIPEPDDDLHLPCLINLRTARCGPSVRRATS